MRSAIAAAGPGGLALLAVLLLCPVAWNARFLVPTWTPYLVLLIPAGAVGLAALATLVRRRDLAAGAAAAVILSALVSAAASGSALNSLKGTVGRDVTAASVILAFGLWALARLAPVGVRRHAPVALVAGVGLTSLVALAQVLFSVQAGPLSLMSGRPRGLTPNPVYLGAFAAAALVYALATVGRRRRALILVVVFTAVVDLSGSRVALMAGLLVGAVAVAVTGRQRWSWLASLACVGGGLVLSGIVSGSRADGPTVNSVGRIDTGRTDGRFEIWEIAWRSFRERPVFGWGLGRFRTATEGSYTPEFVARYAQFDQRQAWFDPHNVVLLMAVGLGIVGVAALAFFGVAAHRGAGGAPLWMAWTLAATWMLQPVSLPLLIAVMLLLGVSAPPLRTPEGSNDPGWLGLRRAVVLPVLAVSTLAVGWIVVADLRMNQAADAVDAAATEKAAEMFYRDASIAELVAEAWTVRWRDDSISDTDRSVAKDKALLWTRRSIAFEPDRAYLRSRLALRQYLFGDDAAAIAAAREALERQPWHAASWRILYLVGSSSSDEALFDEAREAVCLLEMDECNDG